MKANTRKFLDCFIELVKIETSAGFYSEEGVQLSKSDKKSLQRKYDTLKAKCLAYQSKVTQFEYDNFISQNDYLVEYCHEEDVNEWISNGIPFYAEF